jgi:hypothetical protein
MSNPRPLRLFSSVVLLAASLSILTPGAITSAQAAPTSTDTSLSFNGTSQYASVASQQIIPTSTAATFSVEAWVNPSQYISSSLYGMIVSQGTGNNRFYLKLSGGSLANGATVVFFRDGQGTESNCRAIPYNTWSHVAVVVGNSNSSCYINGALVGTFSKSSSASISSTFVVGQYANNIGSTTEYFYGQIDEVKI